MKRVYIGCAGWSIPARHRNLFGDGASVLQRYATLFDAVEINSSFYRGHLRQTYARWATAVPAHFRFSVKMPRVISHEAALGGAGKLVAAFFDEIGALGKTLGVVLIQLPPSLRLDRRIATAFFAQVRQCFDGDVACEPRHPSWFTDSVDAIWRRYRIARVGADPELAAGGGLPAGDPSVRYWRWHGSPKMYYSAYGEARIAALARCIQEDTSAQISWCIFDNTADGHAIADAARLRAAVERAGAPWSAMESGTRGTL